MKSCIVIFAIVIFALAFHASADHASFSKRGSKKGLGHSEEENKKCPVVVGPSKNAFKKNLPQDFCAIFKKNSKIKQADGTQILTGVCSNTPQGEIPTVNNMPSTLILYPSDGDKIKKNKGFTVKVKTEKLELGFFSDPITQYNAFPQALNKKGQIKGHQHVTIQYLGRDKNHLEFPDATKIAFFKGLNDPSNNGILSVDVGEGFSKPGLYRLCTIISSFSHQPVVLPKAQRGASDDCVRFKVV